MRQGAASWRACWPGRKPSCRLMQWRMKSAELRAVADQMHDASAQESLRRTARSHDRIANAAGARLAGQRTAPTKDAG